ncbi:MAG: hypothetical protein Q8L85_01720, partial [Alphaproteobacteria bacterium]|nr:hypothetical protein [Alphaproteobacteria bacterium]
MPQTALFKRSTIFVIDDFLYAFQHIALDRVCFFCEIWLRFWLIKVLNIPYIGRDSIYGTKNEIASVSLSPCGRGRRAATGEGYLKRLQRATPSCHNLSIAKQIII